MIKKEIKLFSLSRLLPMMVVAVASICLLTAMGGLPAREMPVPELDFRVTIIDNYDVSTKCTNASFEGDTFFEGKRGSGIVTIPFEKISKAKLISKANENEVSFQITLKSGDVIAIKVDADARLFGKTSFGTFKIFAKNIKEVVFTSGE